ncbi:hypothetical protein Tco_1154501 [Tanacetum coccineum]
MPKRNDETDSRLPGSGAKIDPRPRGSRKNFTSRSISGTLGNAYVVSYVQFYPNRDNETKEVRQRSSGNPQYQAEGWIDHRGFHGAIQGETTAASKKKGHTSWKPRDQPRRHVLERKSDFRGQSREGRGSNRLRPEIKRQMVLATTSLTDFSGETIWPLGQLRRLVTIGDSEHSTKAWMNFMIVRSLSPYNGIIGRHGIREIQASPSIAHGSA